MTMVQFQTLAARLFVAAAFLCGSAPLLAQYTRPEATRLPEAKPQSPEAPKGETARPEVAKPVLAAQEALKTRNFKEALAKLQEADAIADKTPFENFLIERLRGSAAVGAGDLAVAGKAFDKVIASGRVTPAEHLSFLQTMAGMHFNAKDFPNAIVWGNRYVKEGGTDEQIRRALIQAHYLTGDFNSAATALQAEMQGYETARTAPPEDRLRLLANIHLQRKDDAQYVAAIERLAGYYPKKEYWADVISRSMKRPGFSDRHHVDVYRLMRSTGTLSTPNDYLSLAQLALKAGFPLEAKGVLEQGYAAGVLGTGAGAAEHNKLRDTVAKQAADERRDLAKSEAAAKADKDGTFLVNVGFAYVQAGEAEKGLALMEEGLAKGVARRADDHRLNLGVAYVQAGRKTKAIEVFKTVQGTEGAADLARLWILHASR